MTDKRDLLIEIGTEELPPKSLRLLSEEFHGAVCAGLEQHGLDYRMATPYATPRRLAVLVRGLDVHQPERYQERRGPALQAAFDKDGNPSKAAEGFARSCGVDVAALEREETDKGAWLVHRSVEPGQPTVALVPGIVQNALAALSIPKRMRWGNLDAEFVRPVQWVVLLFGEEVVDAEILRVASGRYTCGHRFHRPEPIELRQPDDYAHALEYSGYVLPVFSVRKERVRLQVQEVAEVNGGMAVIDEDLLDEVTSLVEWPVPVLGAFYESFLRVPAEALVAAMKGHQKYFHLVDDDGRLMPNFIAISNLESRNPEVVRAGNERVIRPRLSDAAFFWDQDCSQSLESRLDKLKDVVFEKRLGSLYDKTRRVAELSGDIAKSLGSDELLGIRVGRLCKCDLLTQMVNEFPELQGVMGEYYAANDGENPAVGVALREYYQPRFGGDALPETPLGQAAALADRIDTLVGIFGIGQAPTGDKDPYGLRRAAIGVLRILIEGQLPLDLAALFAKSVAQYRPGVLRPNTATEVYDFVLERIRYYYQEQGAPAESVDAVLVCRPSKPLDIDLRLRGVELFRQLPAAASLAAANKRIHNLLKKTDEAIPGQADPTYFKDAAERTLFDAIEASETRLAPLLACGDYQAALEDLANLREPVDTFFDNVMVMDEDRTVRGNRLALLLTLRNLFLQVADISRLPL